MDSLRSKLVFLFVAFLVARVAHAASDEHRHELVDAVQRGDAAAVGAFLAKGAPANVDVDGSSTRPRRLMSVAAQRGDEAIVELLLRHGADPNAPNDFPYRMSLMHSSPSDSIDNGMTALMYAADAGHVGVMRRLIAARAQVNVKTVYGETALMFAAARGGPEPVRMLIAAGADIHAEASQEDAWAVKVTMGLRHYGGTALLYALVNRRADAAEPLIAAQEKSRRRLSRADTIAKWAVACCNVELVARLVALGAVRKDSKALLSLSQGRDRPEVVKLLVQAGADVNARDEKPFDDTPLMRAAMHGLVRSLAALLDAGAAINATMSYGESALWRAAYTKQAAAVDVLLARGADPNLRATPNPMWFSRGGTALSVAVAEGCMECARHLLARGADPNIPDSTGSTPLEALQRAGLLK